MKRKVLLIRLSSLGDVVLSTAAVEALAAKGGYSVSVLTKPQFAEVFENNPGVAEVIAWGEDEGPRDIAAKVGSGGYDWIVDLHANLRTRALKPLVRGSWSVYRKGSLRGCCETLPTWSTATSTPFHRSGWIRDVSRQSSTRAKPR